MDRWHKIFVLSTITVYKCGRSCYNKDVRPSGAREFEAVASDGYGGTRMQERAAVIFIPDDTGKTGLKQPLMLMDVCGSPLLAWTAGALADGGRGAAVSGLPRAVCPGGAGGLPRGDAGHGQRQPVCGRADDEVPLRGRRGRAGDGPHGPCVLIPGQTESGCAYSLNGHYDAAGPGGADLRPGPAAQLRGAHDGGNRHQQRRGAV